jgi:hypothetical protein
MRRASSDHSKIWPYEQISYKLLLMSINNVEERVRFRDLHSRLTPCSLRIASELPSQVRSQAKLNKPVQYSQTLIVSMNNTSRL